MKPLFFLYVLSNLTRIAELRKEDLVKHIRKEQFRRVDYFFRLPLVLQNHNHLTRFSKANAIISPFEFAQVQFDSVFSL